MHDFLSVTAPIGWITKQVLLVIVASNELVFLNV